MGYKRGSHPDDNSAYPHSINSGHRQGMSYYEWLVGQLAKNPQFIPYSASIDGDEIAENIINVADKLIKKMENK